MKTIFKELIFCDLNLSSSEDVITYLGAKLQEKGYVKDTFVESVLKRESVYPTGIPSVPYCVAIPHTDQGDVNYECVAFARMRREVSFKTILGTGEELPVKFVFLLATMDNEGHLNFIKNLMKAFQDEERQQEMAEAKDEEELYKILSRIDEEEKGE